MVRKSEPAESAGKSREFIEFRFPDHTGERGAVLRRERLGGMLNYYYRAAA
jgi:hypothetical protein